MNKNYTKGAASVIKMILIASFLPILLILLSIYRYGLDSDGFTSLASIIATSLPIILASAFNLYCVKILSPKHSAMFAIFAGTFIFFFVLILFTLLLKMFFPIEVIGEAVLSIIVLFITMYLSTKFYDQNQIS